MSKKISLKQFLMKTGRFEKVYDCVTSIRNGKITVNGKIVTNPNYFFNPKTSLVKIDGEKLKQVSKFYFILNKPAGYLSQKHKNYKVIFGSRKSKIFVESENEKTIYDILKKLEIGNAINSLFAIGRLDKDTEGLLIITNDGKLSNMLMNPENDIIKKYYAVLEKPVDKNKIRMLEKGVQINLDEIKYKTKPCKIKITGEKEIYISITEGKKRQIRKMFEAVDNKVVYLKRVSIGSLSLGKLKTGEIKQLKRDEIYNHFNIQ